MAVLKSSKTVFHKSLSRQELQQRLLRIPPSAPLFASEEPMFSLWHKGRPWAARLRTEPCHCPHPPIPHRHQLLLCAELFAGLEWSLGAELRFERTASGRIEVSGALQA